MSEYYVIVTSAGSEHGDKWDLLDPPIYGPFESDDAAYAFIELSGVDRGCESYGGYSAAHVIGEGTVAEDPLGYVIERIGWSSWDDAERLDKIEKCRKLFGDEAATEVAKAYADNIDSRVPS